jgi:type II secretory pathway pseudopilin PulG
MKDHPQALRPFTRRRFNPTSSLCIGSRNARQKRLAVSLVELLVVIVIIIILGSIGLAAIMGVTNASSRSRTTTEIQTIGTALEGYKTDHEIYPPSTGLTTSTYASRVDTPTLQPLLEQASGGPYTDSSTVLFDSLTGTTNFSETAPPGAQIYLTLNANQVGNLTGASFIQDPWGHAYGYATGPRPSAATAANPPYNGVGSYDLWSTGNGAPGTTTFTNSWICNWH